MLSMKMVRLAAIGCVAAFLSGTTAGTANAAIPESSESIKIAMNNWTSQNVLSYITGQLLEKMGYTVEYIPSDSQLQFQALGNGDLDFQVEVWEGSMAEAFAKSLESGDVVDAGSHTAVTREDWWYPQYVKDVCPGLPDWKALDACAEKFATAETKPKGRFVGPPADWGKHYSERIQALKMNFQEVPVGQAATLWAELQAAYDRKEPIVLFNWTPNFIEAKFPGEFVDFPDPASDAKCKTQPEYCGAPKSGYLKKAAWKGVQEKWPAAFAVMQHINFNNEQIAKAASMVDTDGLSPEEAAAKWISDNPSAWKEWVPAD